MCKLSPVGQIGLGTIGSIYAGHLLARGGALVVYDQSPSRVALLRQDGATPAETPAEVASQCNVIILALPTPSAVREALLGDGGLFQALRPDAVVIDLSTVDPGTSKEMYACARARAAHYLDAPVSGGAPGGGGTDGARAASLTFMVGGDHDVFEAVRPILEMLGNRFFYLGPAGAGTAAKLISNMVSGLHNLVAAEAIALGGAVGLGEEALGEVFDGTDAKSYWFSDYLAPRLRRGDFAPGFTIDLQLKDHRLAADMAQQVGVPLLFNQDAIRVYEALRDQGFGGDDVARAARTRATEEPRTGPPDGEPGRNRKPREG